jgi:hypothetical protein
VKYNLPVLIQNAEVHGASVQIDATIKLVLLGVKSHEVSSSSLGCLPNASIPRRYAEEGASISINPLQRTGGTVAVPTLLVQTWVVVSPPAAEHGAFSGAASR